MTGDELYCKRILTNGEEEDTLGATGVKGDVLYCCGGSDGRPPLSMGQTYRKASLKKKKQNPCVCRVCRFCRGLGRVEGLEFRV